MLSKTLLVSHAALRSVAHQTSLPHTLPGQPHLCSRLLPCSYLCFTTRSEKKSGCSLNSLLGDLSANQCKFTAHKAHLPQILGRIHPPTDWAEFIQVPCYFLQILLFLQVSSQLFLIADLGLTRSAVMPILTPAPMIYSRQSRSIRLSVKTQPSLNISSKAGSRT